MFRWLKRRLINEHRKLLFQNDRASNDSELRLRLRFNGQHDLADRLISIAETATRMSSEGVPTNGLSPDETELGLKLNKELRYLFEMAYSARPSDFDPKYVPLGGWDFYFERKDEGA